MQGRLSSPFRQGKSDPCFLSPILSADQHKLFLGHFLGKYYTVCVFEEENVLTNPGSVVASLVSVDSIIKGWKHVGTKMGMD